jgi:hypothetical protein
MFSFLGCRNCNRHRGCKKEVTMSTSPSSTSPSPLALAASLAGTGESLIMGLLAAHDARVRAAKEENTAVQQAVQALDADLKTIFTAANNGDITAAVAMSACYDVHLWYWSFVQPFQQGSTKGPQQTFPNPGAPNSNATGGIYYEATDGGNCHCGTNKNCTAGCCIGCGAIDPTLSNAYAGFKTGKAFTMTVATIVANKYGLAQRNAYQLSYKPPKVTNPEAEVTLNTKTGVLTVGAAPATNDAVVATGVVSKSATPDTGGDQIQHSASGTDVNITSAPGTFSLASIPGGEYTVIAALFLLLLALFLPSKG